jgi:hypothetical protein
VILVAQDEVGGQHPDEAEGQQRDRVADPALLLERIDAADAVRQPLDGLDDPVEPCAALRIEHLHQVEPERLRDEQERADVERELEPGVGIVHVRNALELLGPQDRDDEVGEAGEGDQAYEDVFHGRAGMGRVQRTFSQKYA